MAVVLLPLYMVKLPSKASRVITTFWVMLIVTEAQTELRSLSSSFFMVASAALYKSPIEINPLDVA